MLAAAVAQRREILKGPNGHCPNGDSLNEHGPNGHGANGHYHGLATI